MRDFKKSIEKLLFRTAAAAFPSFPKVIPNTITLTEFLALTYEQFSSCGH